MKLLRLQIERHTYGDRKGQFSGEATFTGETGKVTLHLNDHHIEQMLLVCADGIIESAKAAARSYSAENPPVPLYIENPVQPADVQPITDTERLDYMQAHPEKFIRYRKGKWAFLGFTNYEFDMHPTLREAIDASTRT